MPAAADRIELRGLRLLATVGVLDHEQAGPQPIEVDLDVVCDLSAAGQADDLRQTVDYSSVCARVEALATSRTFGLLEALAEAVAAEVLTDERVDEVEVGVRKLRPPVPQQLDTSGVRITRRR